MSNILKTPDTSAVSATPESTDAPIIIETHKTPDAAIIWLHGLGADGHDFAGLASTLQLPEKSKIRFILPHAPLRPVTLNGGKKMRAWYDIVSLERIDGQEDEAGIEASRVALIDLIQQQVDSGIKPNRIILAGFSQGGAIALATGIQANFPLAGILALSSYLPMADKMPSARPHSPEIMMMHGEFDDVIDIRYAKDSKDCLVVDLGYRVSWKTYQMVHQICPQQIPIIRNWIIDKLTTTTRITT